MFYNIQPFLSLLQIDSNVDHLYLGSHILNRSVGYYYRLAHISKTQLICNTEWIE